MDQTTGNKSGQAWGNVVKGVILSMWRWAISPIPDAQYSCPAQTLVCPYLRFFRQNHGYQVSESRARDMRPVGGKEGKGEREGVDDEVISRQNR